MLVLIASCTVQQIESSNVATTPIPVPSTLVPEPNLSPEAKPPQDVSIPIVQPEPIVAQFNLSNATPGTIPCLDDCQNNCKETAHIACTQKERAACRASCGEIIANTACVQACTYLSRPDLCKQQFEKFCSAQCVRECY